ncbi:hypothetical protein [Crossiella sp. NPDC003009]
MQPASPAIVAQPVTDRPAIEDALAVGIRDYQLTLVRAPLGGAALCAALGGLVYLLGITPVAWAAALGGAALLLVLQVVLTIWFVPQNRAAKELMTAQSWRQVHAEVLGLDGRHFVVEAEGRRLRIQEMGGRVAHLVVRRTGRLWLVGPDEAGLVLARIEGPGTPLFGKVTTETGTPVTPEPEQADGTAAADPVSVAWAGVLARAINYRIWPDVAAFVLVALVMLGFLLVQGVSTGSVVASVLVLAIAVPLLLRRHLKARRRFRSWTSLPELLHAGAWQPVGITLAPAQLGPLGGNAHGVIRLASGVDLPIQLPDAGLDLVGNIQAMGGLWVAGDPVPGKVFAVGYPGYPILGLATFNPGMTQL